MTKSVSKAWSTSAKNIRAVQVIFELEEEHSRHLRIAAITQGLSASDYIRGIIGLERKKPVRPRLSISLSEDDYVNLAKRYNKNADNKSAIRQCIKQELIKQELNNMT